MRKESTHRLLFIFVHIFVAAAVAAVFNSVGGVELTIYRIRQFADEFILLVDISS